MADSCPTDSRQRGAVPHNYLNQSRVLHWSFRNTHTVWCSRNKCMNSLYLLSTDSCCNYFATCWHKGWRFDGHFKFWQHCYWIIKQIKINSSNIKTNKPRWQLYVLQCKIIIIYTVIHKCTTPQKRHHQKKKSITEHATFHIQSDLLYTNILEAMLNCPLRRDVHWKNATNIVTWEMCNWSRMLQEQVFKLYIPGTNW